MSAQTPDVHVSTTTTVAAPATPPPAAEPAKAKSNNGRLRRLRKAPLTITDAAAERIQSMLSSKPDVIGVRLGVKRRGCNGLSYVLNYAEDVRAADEEVSEKGVRVFVEPSAVFHVVGTTMDWEETTLSAEFTFVNPNEKGRCGCGESFNV